MKLLKAAPNAVVNSVKEYFKRELPNYEVVSVLRKHPETAPDNDNNLFLVIARTKSGKHVCWTCWTCWNNSTKSLNYGHYCISLQECFKLAMEYCESVPCDEAKSGLFIKKDSDFLELTGYGCSFLVNNVEADGVHFWTLNGSNFVVIALEKTEV